MKFNIFNPNTWHLASGNGFIYDNYNFVDKDTDKPYPEKEIVRFLSDVFNRPKKKRN
jgi:hypothetical protein